METGTAAGKLAAEYMNKGQLVPNKVVVDMVKHRLAQPDAQDHGWLLDGYPRSADQAAAILEEGIHPDVFFLIQVCRAGCIHSCLVCWHFVGNNLDRLRIGRRDLASFAKPTCDDHECLAVDKPCHQQLRQCNFKHRVCCAYRCLMRT